MPMPPACQPCCHGILLRPGLHGLQDIMLWRYEEAGPQLHARLT